MVGFLRRVLILVALVAFGWAGWRYLDEQGGGDAADTAASQSEIAAAPAPAPPPPAPAPASNAMVGTESVSPQTTRSLASGAGASSAGDIAGALNQEADIAYNRPDVMRLGRSTNVQLVMDASGDADLRAMLEGFIGEVVETRVGVASEVSASLSGPGFEIEALSPQRQALSLDNTNRWQWNVRPLEEGRRTMVLDIYAYVGDAARPVRTYRDEIEVTVNTLDRVIAMAQTAHPVIGIIAGAVSLLFAGMGLARRRRERRGG